MKHKIYLTIGILLIWQVISLLVHKSVIFPCPMDVIYKMIMMLADISFYQTIVLTLSHVIIVVIVSSVVSFLLAYVCFIKPIIEEYISPLMTLIQSIPTIAFVFIALVWTSSLQTVYIVLSFVIFPLLYHNFIQGFKSIDRDLIDAIALYHPPMMERLFKVYLPLVRSYFISGLKSSLSLGVKVAVMAEILAALPYGVGRAMNFARIQVDTTTIFAWTLWLVIMIGLIDYIFKKLIP